MRYPESPQCAIGEAKSTGRTSFFYFPHFSLVTFPPLQKIGSIIFSAGLRSTTISPHLRAAVMANDTSTVIYGEPTISVLPHIPRPRLKHAPLAPEDRKALKEQRNKIANDIAEDVAEWHQQIRDKAGFLAEKYNKTQQYFLQLLFNEPTEVDTERKVNFRNAWAWYIARDKTAGKLPFVHYYHG